MDLPDKRWRIIVGGRVIIANNLPLRLVLRKGPYKGEDGTKLHSGVLVPTGLDNEIGFFIEQTKSPDDIEADIEHLRHHQFSAISVEVPLEQVPVGFFHNFVATSIAIFGPIDTLPEGMFSDLHSLEGLSISTLYDHRHVEVERYYGTEWEDIPEDLIAGCTNLRRLLFKGIKTKAIPRTLLDDCPQLEELKLSSLPITRLPKGLLKSKERLTTLRLTDLLYLQELEPDLLADCPNLETIEIGQTDITAIPPGFFDACNNLIEVTIKNSGGIGYLPAGVFGHNPRLQRIYLEGDAREFESVVNYEGGLHNRARFDLRHYITGPSLRLPFVSRFEGLDQLRTLKVRGGLPHLPDRPYRSTPLDDNFPITAKNAHGRYNRSHMGVGQPLDLRKISTVLFERCLTAILSYEEFRMVMEDFDSYIRDDYPRDKLMEVIEHHPFIKDPLEKEKMASYLRVFFD